MPTFEPDPSHLKQAIESVLAQTETRWHLWIHDDASRADVHAMIEPYLLDTRITFARSTKRLGIGANWNASVALGSAPFVQLLFQDDLWEPTYLERALHACEHSDAIGLVASAHHYAFEGDISHRSEYEAVEVARKNTWKNGSIDGNAFLRSWIERELHPNLIGEPSFVLLRRSLIKQVGRFCEDMPQFLDVEYWTRCLSASDCAFVLESGGAFRVHPKGASAQNQLSGAGIYDRLRCFERLITSLPHSSLRRAAITARDRALSTMIRKFFRRVRSGGHIPVQGTSGLRLFVFQHPFLIIKAFLAALRSHT